MNSNLAKAGKFVGVFLAIALVFVGLVFLGKIQDNAPEITIAGSVIPEVTSSDHITGAADSQITLVEYSDFECPACKQYQPIITQLIADYGDRVRFVYRHFPIYSKHPNAEAAARAAEAASKQGKFFEFAQVLFDHQDDWATLSNPKDKFTEYAAFLSLNVDQFKADFSNGASKAAVDADYKGGVEGGVNGTPTLFLNGIMLVGSASYQAVTAAIDAEIAKFNAIPTITPDANGSATVELNLPETPSTK